MDRNWEDKQRWTETGKTHKDGQTVRQTHKDGQTVG